MVEGVLCEGVMFELVICVLLVVFYGVMVVICCESVNCGNVCLFVIVCDVMVVVLL